MTPRHIGILGTGRFATALGLTLNRAGHKVTFIGRTRQSTKHCLELLPQFAGSPMPKIRAFYKKPVKSLGYKIDPAEFDAIIIGTSLEGLGWALSKIPGDCTTPIVLVQKGLDDKFRSPFEIVQEALPNADTLLFTGALFARDLANPDVYDHPDRYAFGMIVGHAAGKRALATSFVSLWENSPIWPVTSTNPRSISICNAIRTVESMAMGIVSGYVGEENASTIALIRTAINQEAWLLAMYLGVDRDTRDNGSRVWRVLQADLDLCVDLTSRNNQLGRLIGRGVPIDEAKLRVSQNGVMESVQNVAVLARAIDKPKEEWKQLFPYFAGVSDIVAGKHVQEVASDLLARRQRYINAAP